MRRMLWICVSILHSCGMTMFSFMVALYVWIDAISGKWLPSLFRMVLRSAVAVWQQPQVVWWLLPLRQVDLSHRGSLAGPEDHLCRTCPAAQGLPVHNNKAHFAVNCDKSVHCNAVRSQGFCRGVQSFLFLRKDQKTS